LAFYLTPGQIADIKGAVMLAAHLPRTRYLLADKAYDADHWRACLLRQKIQPVITYDKFNAGLTVEVVETDLWFPLGGKPAA
jgi:transposase